MATSANKLKRQVIASFKRRGLSLSPSALQALLNILSHKNSSSSNDDPLQTISQILDEIRDLQSSLSNTSNIINKDFLSTVIASMTKDDSDLMNEALQLIDLHTPDSISHNMGMPVLKYDSMKKRFSLDTPPKSSYFGTVDDKIDMLLQRYHLIQQRLLRQPMFQKNHNGESISLTAIEGLLGATGTKILLGIIHQGQDGQYLLEDPSSSVPMDISQAEFLSDGFITEQSIVLVEGKMQDGILLVHRIGQPIYESRKSAVSSIGLQNCDFFRAIPTLSELSKLQQEELDHGEESMFVLLSDVHLDNPKVLERLQKMFQGYQQLDPLPVFILMGDFMSKYPSSNEKQGSADMFSSTIMGYFDDLANVIATAPKVQKEGKFIIVPGPNDPGLSHVYPRPKIPDYFTQNLRRKVTNVHMTSNPCRLRFFSQEYVIGRLDVVKLLRKECIVDPPMQLMDAHDKDGENANMKDDKNQDVSQVLVQHAIKTMLSQGNLCPVPNSTLPVYWTQDHLMRLYPPPNAIFLGDQSAQPYYETYEKDCDIMNPGAFHLNGEFLVFRPVDLESGERKADCEFSQID